MSPPSQFFRANVGALLCGGDGRVLAFERRDRPASWQLPQGGLEAGERPADAVLREIYEETRVDVGNLRLLGEHPQLLAYELPEASRSEKTGRGQVQYWFYFACCSEPRLLRSGEFRAWRWMELGDLLARVVEFRRPVYAQLAEHFDRVMRPRLEKHSSSRGA